MATTWNPSDKTSGVTLSNGDLSADGNSGYTYGLGRAVNGFDSGKKVYYEVVIDAFTSSATNWIVGGCQSSSATSAGLFDGGIRAFGAGTQSGNTSLWAWNDGAPVGSALGTPAVNDVVGICVDRVNNRFWARLNNGNWNGSGTANPATNTGGLDISLCTSPYPAYTLISTAEGATARFSRSSWTYAAPAGFVEINAPTAATLNPSDVAGGTPTFSNGNKTIASGTDGVGMWSRSSGGSSSKFYFECYVTGNTAIEYAVTNATQGLTTIGDAAPNKGIAIYASSNWSFYSDNIPNYGTIATGIGSAGDRICVAVDPVNGKLWARLNNGNWNNSGTDNPATNTGGVDVSSVGSTLYAVAKSSYTYISASVYLAQADWLYSAPVGFGQVPPDAPRTLYFQQTGYQIWPSGAGGTTYNVTVAETITAITDAVTGVLTITATMPESIATADAQTGLAIFPRAVAETVTATTDAQTGLLSMPVTVAESMAPSDAPAATMTMPGTVAESMGVADSPASILTAVGTVAESMGASDTQSTTAIFAVTLSESVAISDTQAGLMAMAVDVAESLAATDAFAGGLFFAVTVAESVATSDAQTGLLTMLCDRAEIMGVADSPNATAAFVLSVAETAGVSDSVTGLLTIAAAVAESVASADAETGGSVFAVTVDEAGSIADASSLQVTLAGSVAEAVSIADACNAQLVAVAAVVETAAIVDSQSEDGPPPVGTDEYRVGGGGVKDIVQTLNVATIHHTQKKTGPS